jgi:trk system potassium uptake protein TrkH
MQLDLRPIGYVIGILLTLLGIAMLVPMFVDFLEGRGFVGVFAESALITVLTGSFLAIACSNGKAEGLDIQKTILLTTGVWIALPLFGSIPFIIGSTQLSFVDALFEAVSGVTTTGSTVLSGLQDLPKGILLWRGILQWLGGIGIIVVAMVFLPELRVGGMQIFRAEAFDTMGKILPRATTISLQIFVIYLGITVMCALSYVAVGLTAFDAIVHAFTTVSTGGFSNYDSSFGHFSGAVEYVAIIFMIMAALPFVRYVQLVNGNSRAIFSDTQIKTFLITTFLVATFVFFVLNNLFPGDWESALRKSLFNITSIISGTGYSSDNYMAWGGMLVSVIFFIGLIGGCAGSTTCSVKVFDISWLLLLFCYSLEKFAIPTEY